MYCSSCGAQVSPHGRFCSTCGSELDSNAEVTLDSNEISSDAETIVVPSSSRRPPSLPATPRSPRTPSGSSASVISSDPIAGGRFVSGQMIAGRYRIVSMVGRGGMGEVYRAEDLTLGQVVAIKFLPEALSQNSAALSRFHSEVRIARQVSHPNVCRVFDIGDADGALFLSMEFVDGEDLASVVRRIGRLSPERATEVARQICAGLAAAHERGVIHRDLKPANVMLDGAGKIRISDFGLAAVAAGIEGADVRAGTPAYMAPEQLAGKEVTARSDIYSLGLILYEILTGKRAFEASTLPELMKLRESGTITNPSTLVRDLDPLIERVILRCLEKDPAQRPASALKVAAALPGGDPLAAALAAGETPSPEMVAAAGAKEGMRPRSAAMLFGLAIVGLIASVIIGERVQLVNRAPLGNSPDVLAARAREVVAQLGISAAAADSVYGIDTDEGYLSYIREHDKTPTRWRVLSADRPSAFLFWYRQSPRPFDPPEFYTSFGGGGVTLRDPPMNRTGMVSLVLDAQGRLLHLETVPPQKDPPAKSVPTPNWSRLFSAAGLDASSFRSAEPEWSPLAYADSRAAWTGALPGRPDLPIRIETAAYRGQAVYFDLLFPWSTADRDAAATSTRAEDIHAVGFLLVISLILLGGALVGRWNLKQGRADQKGAVRLCAFVFLTALAMSALWSHHVADLGELVTLVMGIAWALLLTFFVLVPYLALEPFVRRREPHILISWTRLLGGGVRDPLVGCDLLIGVVYGVLVFLLEGSDNLILPLLGKLAPQPGGISTDAIISVRSSLAILLFLILFYTLYSLCVFFLLFFLQRLLRKTWLAATAVAGIGVFLSLSRGGGEAPVFAAVALMVLYLSFLFVLKRFGLLPLVVGLVVQNVMVVFPATVHLSRWYSVCMVTGLGSIALLAAYAFHAALAGQRIFSLEAIDR